MRERKYVVTNEVDIYIFQFVTLLHSSVDCFSEIVLKYEW